MKRLDRRNSNRSPRPLSKASPDSSDIAEASTSEENADSASPSQVCSTPSALESMREANRQRCAAWLLFLLP